jgi:hypothetical protein
VDGSTDDVQLLLASAGYEIEILKADPRLKPFDGSRGEALRQHVEDLIGAAEFRLGQEPRGEAPPAVRRSFSRSIRDIILMLRAAHAAMPWLAATQEPSVNLGSLYLTEELAALLVGSKVDLVMVPDVEFMYSTVSWPFSEVIEETKGFTPQTHRRPIILYYPLSDSDRLLLHSIFSHELGHSAVAEAQLVNKVNDQIHEDPTFETALGKAVENMEVAWPASSSAKISGTLQSWLSSWLEELLCDHLAIEATGPAYLWAFAGFVMPLSYADEHPGYPPNTVRTKLALDLLDERGWTPYMEETAPEILTWLRSIAADSSESLGQPFDFLRKEVLKRSHLLRETAAAQVGVGRLDPEKIIPEATEAAELLELLILPVGAEDPLTSRAILLGGWQEGLRVHGDSPQGLVESLGDNRLQNLVGKAIEMSAIVRAWE